MHFSSSFTFDLLVCLVKIMVGGVVKCLILRVISFWNFFFGLNKKVDDIDVTSLMMKPPFLPSINHAFSPLSLEL